MRRTYSLVAILLTVGGLVFAQRLQVAAGVRQFVKVDAPVIALTHVRVIDGTGAPARADQTLVIRDGLIAAVGTNVTIPEGATVIDATGKSVMPGLVMLHEHTYYPTGPKQQHALRYILEIETNPKAKA